MSENTDIYVACGVNDFNQALLTFAGEIDNQGTITFGTYAAIGFENGTIFTEVDIREVGSIEITNEEGMVYITETFTSFEGWVMQNWKADILITMRDGAGSTKYELRDHMGGTHILDYRGADSATMANNWISDMIGGQMMVEDIAAEVAANIADPTKPDYVQVTHRIRSETAKEFTIDVEC